MSILNKLFKKETAAPIAKQAINNLPDLSRFNKKSNFNAQELVDKAKAYTTPVPKATAMTLKKLIMK